MFCGGGNEVAMMAGVHGVVPLPLGIERDERCMKAGLCIDLEGVRPTASQSH